MRSKPLAFALQGALLLARPPEVGEAPLRAHLAFLADDLLEGRGTGQRGGELAVRYLETQLQALGFRPANGASYRQKVTLAGTTLRPGTRMAFQGTGGTVSLALGRELVMGASSPTPLLKVDAPLVFVGHGMSGRGQDDYQGLDARGRILVMLVGPREDGPEAPPCCQPENYQARWTAKFEEARRRKAAGVLLIHTAASAGYDWPVVSLSWMGERFQLAPGEGPGQLQGWFSEAGARKALGAAGWDLDDLRARANRPGFRPVELGLRASGRVEGSVRTLEQWNVAGVLPGTDPDLRGDLVVFSAHWDHFGVGEGPLHPIHNGAVDNASGCAAVLALAQALSAHPAPRSVMCLFPCAEEQGLLGSRAYVQSPLWPLSRTLVDINLESLNFVGRTRDISLLGATRAPLLELGRRTAEAMGLRIAPPRKDPSGLCFRADSHSFAMAGVPALSPGFSLDGGWDYVEDPAGSQARARAFLGRYHTPGDRYDPAWDLSGMVQQAQFALNLGWALAEAPVPAAP